MTEGVAHGADNLPCIMASITDDGRHHTLYYVCDQGKYMMGGVKRSNNTWVFTPYGSATFDADELWLIVRYLVDLNYNPTNE